MNLGVIRNILASYFEGKGVQRNVSPEDITRWLNVAQLTHFKRRTGLPEEYKPGTPIPSHVAELTKRNCKVMLSNSSAPLVYDLYDRPPYRLIEMQARRNINSKGNRRGPIKELLILNY